MGQYTSGQDVSLSGDKWKVQGYRNDGRAILENSQGNFRYAYDSELTRWTDAVTRLNIRRFVNIYEGDKVGDLVREQSKTDHNARNSRRKRIGVAEIVLVTEGNGNVRAETKFTKTNS